MYSSCYGLVTTTIEYIPVRRPTSLHLLMIYSNHLKLLFLLKITYFIDVLYLSVIDLQ